MGTMIRQRDVVAGLAALSAAAIPLRKVAAAHIGRQAQGVTRHFDAYELQTSAADLLSLRDGLAGFSPVGIGPRTDMLWLKGSGGQIWAIGVDSRDLEFKFEVFTLTFETEGELAHRVLAAPPLKLPAETPEWMRKIAAQPRVVPKPPEFFTPWPLRSWRVEVIRRSEWIIGDLQPPPPTFGDNPVSQNASKPGEVPPEAWARCDVAVGLLFTEADRRRFLIATDWMPLNMIVTQDAATIDDFVEACEFVDLSDYALRLRQSQI